MSEKSIKAADDDLRPEYRREDLGPGVRGKYFQQYHSISSVKAVHRGLRDLRRSR